ncbi:MAG: hypothetical protein WKF66_12505 [Pedobacter sp.]
MENNVNESIGNKFLNKLQKNVVIVSLIFSMLFAQTWAHAQSSKISAQLSTQLNSRAKQSTLHFPKSVKRYYVQNKLKMVWIDRAQEKQTHEAMLLLDCVLQYGLAHADYHPAALVYDNLQAMLNDPGTISIEQRINFDIMLTDAMINLINNLHYGKLNPYFSAKKLDGMTKSNGFNAVAELVKANDGADFTAAILTAQPKSKTYIDLQRYMRLVKGQYVGDCYEVPEAQVRKVAINMERLRWWEFAGTASNSQKSAYLTCKIVEGLPVFYKDTRNLDPSLEAAMYYPRKPSPSTNRIVLPPNILPKKG